MAETTDSGAPAGGSAGDPKGGDASAAGGTSLAPADSSPSGGTAAGGATTPTGATGQEAAKPTIDLDAVVRTDRQWQASRRAQETALKAREDAVAALEPLRPLVEHLPKVDQAAVISAVAALAGGDRKGAIAALVKLDAYTEDNAKLVIELADHVAAQRAAAEVPVADQIKQALAAEKAAERKKAEEEEQRKADEAKAAEAKGAEDWASELESYTASAANVLNPASPKFLPEFQQKFPWCAKLFKGMAPALFQAEIKRRLDASESVNYGDVFEHFEKKWVEDLGPAPAPRAAAPAPDAIAKALDELEAGRAPTITVRDGGEQRPATRPTAPGQGSAMDEIQRELDAIEAAKRAPRRY